MKGKKIISTLLALATVASISVAAFADSASYIIEHETVIEGDPDHTSATQDVTIYTYINPSFVINIPTTIQISNGASSASFNVELDESSVLEKDHCVYVEFSGSNYSYDKETGVTTNYLALAKTHSSTGKSDTIAFGISFINYYYYGVDSSSNEKDWVPLSRDESLLWEPESYLEYTMTFADNAWDNLYAGKYTDVLTFNISYIEYENPAESLQTIVKA